MARDYALDARGVLAALHALAQRRAPPPRPRPAPPCCARTVAAVGLVRLQRQG